MNLIIIGLIAFISNNVNSTRTLDYEIFSKNEKIGVARFHVGKNYISGFKFYGFLAKTVVDSVSGMFDDRFEPVTTRRRQIIKIENRGTLGSSSEAYYQGRDVMISLGQTDTILHLADDIPVVDFDFLIFQLPHIFSRLRSGDSMSFYLVFPMGKRAERCVAHVGKGEMVYFNGDTVFTMRIYFTRPGYKSPISVWFTPDLTPIRYYDAASDYQMFLIVPKPASAHQDRTRR